MEILSLRPPPFERDEIKKRNTVEIMPAFP